jgi:hypothetical protein
MTETELKLMINGIQQLQKGQDKLADGQAEIIERLDHLDECVDLAKASIKHVEQMLKEAVPDGNIKGHHDYHLEQMQKWNFWHKIKTSVVGKVLEVVVIGLGGWIVLTLWGGFKIVVAN